MAFSVSLTLDKRVKNADGTYTIVVQVIVNRKMTSIATDYSVPEKDWDAKWRKIRKSSAIAGNITRINNILDNRRKEITDKVTALEEAGQLDKLPLKQIRKRIIADEQVNYVFAYTTSLVVTMKENGKIGNARVYGDMLASLKKFTKDTDLPFAHITVEWLEKYRAFYFKDGGKSVNGFGTYARTLRSVYNKAIIAGFAKVSAYPFKHFKITKLKTKKRALEETSIKKFKDADTQDGLRKTRAKDYFLASFYLRGISFVDLAHLKVQYIKNGRLKYERQKTGYTQQLDIKIVPQLQEIFDRYIIGKSSEDYIFPIIKRKSPEDIYKDIKTAIRLYNRTLRIMADENEMPELPSSGWARHSWATSAKRKGVPTAVISEGLGHDSEKTTQIYLDSFETDVLDDANALVVG